MLSGDYLNNTPQSFKPNLQARFQGLKEPFENDEQYTQQKHDDADLIDSMHHPNVDIGRP